MSNRKRRARTKKRKPYAKIRQARIPRAVLLHTSQIGPVIAQRAVAFAARELLMNMYGIDATIYPFGADKFQLRIYNGLGHIERSYAAFFVKQLDDLFTWPIKRRQILAGAA